MLISSFHFSVKKTSLSFSDRLSRASVIFQLFLFRSSTMFEIALRARKGIFSLAANIKKSCPFHCLNIRIKFFFKFIPCNFRSCCSIDCYCTYRFYNPLNCLAYPGSGIDQSIPERKLIGTS